MLRHDSTLRQRYCTMQWRTVVANWYVSFQPLVRISAHGIVRTSPYYTGPQYTVPKPTLSICSSTTGLTWTRGTISKWHLSIMRQKQTASNRHKSLLLEEHPLTRLIGRVWVYWSAIELIYILRIFMGVHHCTSTYRYRQMPMTRRKLWLYK